MTVRTQILLTAATAVTVAWSADCDPVRRLTRRVVLTKEEQTNANDYARRRRHARRRRAADVAGRDGLKTFSAFLSLSRSGRALVSDVATHDDAARSLLVYVRKIDDEFACMGVQLAGDISRKSVVKCMRDAGVKVQNLPGKITATSIPINCSWH